MERSDDGARRALAHRSRLIKEEKIRDEQLETSDKWDEKYEIMGKRKSSSFVDTFPIIFRGGQGKGFASSSETDLNYKYL